MSLRKSPQLTPQLLAPAPQNAQHSTGPRSAAAKKNSKLNALKHGQRATPENHHEVMLALGEDPQEFGALYQGRMGWRQPRLCRLLHLFGHLVELHGQQQDEDYEKFLRETCGPTEQAGEP
jgi:hypothetical protein